MTRAVSIRSNPFNNLAMEASKDAIEMLQDYGNVTTGKQCALISSLISHYSRMAEGTLQGRIAFPLSTGLGKTTSILAFLSRSFKERMLGQYFKVAVATSKVEEACTIFKELRKLGIPEDFISLIHSYKDGSNVELDHDGCLPDGFASVPSTRTSSGDFDCNRPILLVTHNRIKGGGNIEKVLADRAFTVWDESFVSTQATALDIENLRVGHSVLKQAFILEREALGTTYKYLNECFETIDQEFQALLNGSKEKGVLSFPAIPSDKATLKADLDRISTQHKTSLKAWKIFVDKIGEETAVHLGSRNILAYYDVVIPDSLKNVIILDASAEINKLIEYDGSIRMADAPPLVPVTYPNSTFYRIHHPHGYESISEALTTVPFLEELQGIIEKHPEEHILLFTRKNRSGKIRHRTAIEEHLTEQGIDIQQRINGLPRFNWLTHGNETATNKFSHCSVVMFVGVLEQPTEHYLAEVVGQLRNITHTPKASTITESKRSQQGVSLQQGVNRGRSRINNGGIAGKVTAYYTYRDDTLRPYLEAVMPEAQFLVYPTRYLKGKTQVSVWLPKLKDYLRTVASNTVSSRMLNKAVEGWAEVNKNMKAKVCKAITGDTSFPWIKRGQQFYRQ